MLTARFQFMRRFLRQDDRQAVRPFDRQPIVDEQAIPPVLQEAAINLFSKGHQSTGRRDPALCSIGRKQRSDDINGTRRIRIEKRSVPPPTHTLPSRAEPFSITKRFRIVGREPTSQRLQPENKTYEAQLSQRRTLDAAFVVPLSHEQHCAPESDGRQDKYARHFVPSISVFATSRSDRISIRTDDRDARSSAAFRAGQPPAIWEMWSSGVLASSRFSREQYCDTEPLQQSRSTPDNHTTVSRCPLLGQRIGASGSPRIKAY